MPSDNTETHMLICRSQAQSSISKDGIVSGEYLLSFLLSFSISFIHSLLHGWAFPCQLGNCQNGQIVSLLPTSHCEQEAQGWQRQRLRGQLRWWEWGWEWEWSWEHKKTLSHCSRSRRRVGSVWGYWATYLQYVFAYQINFWVEFTWPTSINAKLNGPKSIVSSWVKSSASQVIQPSLYYPWNMLIQHRKLTPIPDYFGHKAD